MRRRNASSVNQRRAWRVRSNLPYSTRAPGFGQGVLAGAGLEAGDEQGGGDVAEFEGPGDAQQVVPVLGDQVDLGVLGEERPGGRPALVVGGGLGPP